MHPNYECYYNNNINNNNNKSKSAMEVFDSTSKKCLHRLKGP